MPIYEYRCASCSGTFSALRAVAEHDAPIACPECGGAETRLMISRVARVRGAPGKRKPRTPQEALAGPRIAGPGRDNTRRSSVLHACSGPGCRVCGG
ncbi:MAG: zinc ribbon domain-containing protein [Gammaproteobacteria bacterium]|nr:zinc ribbon domain-containing protein [Gammaproteobacteria bacterium]